MTGTEIERERKQSKTKTKGKRGARRTSETKLTDKIRKR